MGLLVLHALLSFATITLALKAPRMKDTRTQKIAVVTLGSVLLGVYRFLMSLFRVKNDGYPFWLRPFQAARVFGCQSK